MSEPTYQEVKDAVDILMRIEGAILKPKMDNSGKLYFQITFPGELLIYTEVESG